VKNVSVLIAIGVTQTGYRQILAVSEGAKVDKASWIAFLYELKERGLKCVQLFVSDKCLGLVENRASSIRKRNGSAAWFTSIGKCGRRCPRAR
jgi:putative transposase